MNGSSLLPQPKLPVSQYSSRLYSHSANLVNLLAHEPCRVIKELKDAFATASRVSSSSPLTSSSLPSIRGHVVREDICVRSRSGFRSVSGLRACPVQASAMLSPSPPMQDAELGGLMNATLWHRWTLLDMRTGMPAGVCADAAPLARHRAAARAAHTSWVALLDLILLRSSASTSLPCFPERKHKRKNGSPLGPSNGNREIQDKKMTISLERRVSWSQETSFHKEIVAPQISKE